MSRILPKALTPKMDDVHPVDYDLVLDPLTGLQKSAFLELVIAGASQHRAAARVGVTMLQIARCRHHEPAFDEDVKLALDYRGEALEELAVDYATRGNEKDVYHNGIPVGTEVVFGPHALLQFLLKGNLRDKYGTERTEVKDTTGDAPPAIRSQADAQKLLAKLKGNALLPPIDVRPQRVLPAPSDDDVDDLL